MSLVKQTISRKIIKLRKDKKRLINILKGNKITKEISLKGIYTAKG